MSCVCSMFSGSISVTGGHRASSREEETWEPLLSLSRRRQRGGNSPRGGSEGTASRGALPAAAALPPPPPPPPPPPAGKCSSLKPPEPLRQVESEAPIGTFRSTGSEQAGRRLWPPGTGCHCDARRQPRRRLWHWALGSRWENPGGRQRELRLSWALWAGTWTVTAARVLRRWGAHRGHRRCWEEGQGYWNEDVKGAAGEGSQEGATRAGKWRQRESPPYGGKSSAALWLQWQKALSPEEKLQIFSRRDFGTKCNRCSLLSSYRL